VQEDDERTIAAVASEPRVLDADFATVESDVCEAGLAGGGRRTKDDRPASRSRRRKRWIFPVAVFGSSAMNSTARGYLCGASRDLTNACSSPASPSDSGSPCFSTTNALVRVSPFSSGTPMTAASSTDACCMSVASTSNGETYWPLTRSMSSERPPYV
jgi:hypothetical protein